MSGASAHGMDNSPAFPRRSKYPRMLAGIRVSEELWQALARRCERDKIALSDYVRDVLERDVSEPEPRSKRRTSA